MRNFLFSSMALAAFLFVPGVASADDVSDRTAAIQVCRSEVAAQEGVDVDRVRLDQVRVRPRAVRVDLDVWRNGALQNVRCDVSRADLTVASITPPPQAGAPTAVAAQ